MHRDNVFEEERDLGCLRMIRENEIPTQVGKIFGCCKGERNPLDSDETFRFPKFLDTVVGELA